MDALENKFYKFFVYVKGPKLFSISAVSREIKWRLWKAHQLASKPAGSPGEVCLLEIRLQSDESISRGFLKSADFEDIYAFVECHELIRGGSPLPEVHKPLEYVHGYKFRLTDTNRSVPTGALDPRDCTVGYIVEKYGIHNLVMGVLRNGEPQRLSKNGEYPVTRQTTIQGRSSPEMEQSPQVESIPSMSSNTLVPARRNPALPTKKQCFALTDEQCRTVQALVDPDGKRLQRNWEFEYQPELIRLYMTGMSFPRIQSAMAPRLTWS
jgi:hypothetical protein